MKHQTLKDMDREAVKGTLCLFSALLYISVTRGVPSLTSTIIPNDDDDDVYLDYSHTSLTYSYASGWSKTAKKQSVPFEKVNLGAG